MKDTVITKAALARGLKCSPGSISAMVAKGMPVREDGKLTRGATLRWIVRNLSGAGGGWGLGLRGPDIRQRAESMLAGSARTARQRAPMPAGSMAGDTETARRAQRELLDSLIVASGRIPEMALKLGLDLPQALAAAETFRSLVIVFAGDIADSAYDWDCEDIPHVATDTAALMAQFNINDYPPGFELEAEGLNDRIDAVIWDTGAGPDRQASAGGATPQPEDCPPKAARKRAAPKVAKRAGCESRKRREKVTSC